MYVWLLKQIIWCIPSMSLLWKKVRQFCFVKSVTWLMVVWLKLCLRIWSEALWLSIFNRQNFRSGFQCFLDNAHSIFVNRQLHMLESTYWKCFHAMNWPHRYILNWVIRFPFIDKNHDSSAMGKGIQERHACLAAATSLDVA